MALSNVFHSDRRGQNVTFLTYLIVRRLSTITHMDKPPATLIEIFEAIESLRRKTCEAPWYARIRAN